jgi:hypothetical protein
MALSLALLVFKSLPKTLLTLKALVPCTSARGAKAYSDALEDVMAKIGRELIFVDQ